MVNKVKMCDNLIRKIINSTYMVGVEYDDKRNQVITKQYAIPKGLQEQTVKFLQEFANSEETPIVHFGMLDFMEGFRSYFTIEDGIILFVIEEDPDRKTVYSGPNNILYGVNRSFELRKIADYRGDMVFEHDTPFMKF